MTNVTVVPGVNPPAPEVLADAIVQLAAGMKRLNESRLRRDTIVLLLHDASGVGKRDIAAVLGALTSLETQYLKPATVVGRAK